MAFRFGSSSKLCYSQIVGSVKTKRFVMVEVVVEGESANFLLQNDAEDTPTFCVPF